MKMTVSWTKTKDALTTLESKLKCFICKNLPVDPQLLWCKHSFCKVCVEDRPSCPSCQFPISPQEMVPDIMLNKLLQAMRVAAQVSISDEEKNLEGRDLEVKEKPILSHKSKKDLHTDKSKINVEKVSNCVKSRRKQSSERKDVPLVEKQSNSVVNTTEIKKRPSRKSSSRGISPQQEICDTLEPIKRTSRGNSLLKEKKEHPEKKNPKTKMRNSSPKASPKMNNLMSTPKPKLTSKRSTPISFSAKKVQRTNKVNSKGETPLQIACRQGKLSLVQQLLREGAEPNVKDYANWTPLCDAVGSGNLEVVRTLLEAGAAVNTPANLNTTALVEAVVRRSKDMVKLLLSHGADMNQRTALNNTALSLADDEMRAVMLGCGQGSVQSPPRVPTAPRAVLIAQLPPPQHDQVMQLCRQFSLSLCTGFSEDITHVVVEKSANNTCTASTAVMLAILNGCSVTGLDWVMSCLEAGKLVAVDEFEPCGTTDFPTSDVFHKARLNREQLLPRLFDGCHISLQHDQPWKQQLKLDTVSIITAAGAVYQPRQCDPERIPQGEATVMYHTASAEPLGAVSHIILYQTDSPAHEPLLKYNMAHVKSLPLSWFHKCIQTFSVTLD